MVTERGLQVLRAIVQDYVDTHEPVGSKSIVERHAFGVSAATIRNDMALLEDEELITAPHTSSGRIPTDKGYRVFVDHLAQLRPLTPAQRSAITTFLGEPTDLDDVLARTVRVLTQLTGQVAIVQYPSFSRATRDAHRARAALTLASPRHPRHRHRPRLPAHRARGRSDSTSPTSARCESRVAALITGRPVREGAERIEALRAATTAEPSRIDNALLSIGHVVAEELEEFRQDRLVMAGAATLARREQDFHGSIHPILEAIEEQVTLLRLMSEMVTDAHGLGASIGRENEAFGLPEASVVTSDYDAGGGTARVGVMGPTRMDYPSNLAAARAVARYLSRLLDEDENRR